MSKDTEATEFDRAVTHLVPDLLRYFARRVEPRDEAADCVSETLLVLWRHRRRLPETLSEQRAWAFGIARKVLLSQRRGRARRVHVDDALRSALSVPIPPAPDEAAIAADALARLSTSDAELIRLVIWDGFTVADAGRMLGIRPATARVRYARALARLRARFHELMGVDDLVTPLS